MLSRFSYYTSLLASSDNYLTIGPLGGHLKSTPPAQALTHQDRELIRVKIKGADNSLKSPVPGITGRGLWSLVFPSVNLISSRMLLPRLIQDLAGRT